MPARKLFTIHEANEAIPFLERRLSRMAKQVSKLQEAAPNGDEEVRRLGQEGGRAVPAFYFRGIQQIVEDSNSLQEKGIILRDLKRGLVDFPAELDGRQVYLCWLRGEARIGYFHEPESGFAGRQPLPPDLS